MQDYEKLGAFYLGRTWDLDRAAVTDDLLLYDAKDLTTHAVCVGMTGSGKTGLCLSLLEEAALDQIPVIAIDPKGDLGNLLLTFPDLRPTDFRPWIDPGAATRDGVSIDEYASRTAATWKSGLAEWGQDGDRIRRLRDAAEFTIFTPGSTAGRPLTVLRSFAAPAAAVAADPEALRDRIQSSVSGLLAMVGIAADPIRSREHILLSSILDQAWRAGRDLDLAQLIGAVQSPPFQKVGVFDLEAFFPASDRFGLAMSLNNLIASPGFAGWMEGEPLDISALLHTANGKPRVSILSIAHLSDAERMFFVTIVLGEIVAWMRAQPGTTSLRAILYMDEVFGYFPPTATPPSKRPMLTLLKQARAFGLGVVLATQNPVDLDYKGLANTGTWFLGRLQTERDKQRVLEGLQGVAAASGKAFDSARMDKALSGLGQRVFLMNNVHDDAPVLFHTRWAMSYLRGPLTRDQIQTLTADSTSAAAAPTAQSSAASAPSSAPAMAPASRSSVAPATAVSSRPALDPDIPQVFLPALEPPTADLLYRPGILASARLHFVDRKTAIDTWSELHLLAPLADDATAPEWAEADRLEDPTTEREPIATARFATLPSAAARAASYASWRKKLSAWLYREQTLTLWRARALDATSQPGESQRDFRIRLRDLARERRDLEIEALRRKYAPQLERLQDRIRASEARIERERDQASHQKMQTAISIGATLLGAVFGRKLTSRSTLGRATTAIRGAGRVARESSDVERAEESREALQAKLRALEEEFEDATAALDGSLDVLTLALDEVAIRPRKSDIGVDQLALAWSPWSVDADGIATPAWET